MDDNTRNINKEVDSVFTLLTKLEDIINNAKTTLSPGVIKVNKDDIHDIIKEIRLSLPKEIKNAQRILHESEDIIKRSRMQAEALIETANRMQDNAIQEHNITKAAEEEAEIIISAAEADATAFELKVLNYLEGVMAKTDNDIQDFIETATVNFNGFMDYVAATTDKINSEREKLKKYAEEIKNDEYTDVEYDNEENYIGGNEGAYDDGDVE